MSRIAVRIFPWLAALVAVTFAWIGFSELQEQSPIRVPSILVAFAISMLFGVTAASLWLQWRIRRLAAIACGLCLALGTFSALTKSWDKVSETGMVILVAITSVTAILALIVGASRTPPDTSVERST